MLLLHTRRTCDESHYYKRIYFQEDNVCSFYTLTERAMNRTTTNAYTFRRTMYAPFTHSQNVR